MIEAAQLDQIIAQYEKHGWKLRLVLASETARDALQKGIPDTPISEAEIDAAWFSRSSKPGVTAWDIRLLSGEPYALVEVIDDAADQDHLESVLRGAEEKIRQIALKRRPQN